jgi:hypothetical protein
MMVAGIEMYDVLAKANSSQVSRNSLAGSLQQVFEEAAIRIIQVTDAVDIECMVITSFEHIVCVHFVSEFSRQSKE